MPGRLTDKVAFVTGGGGGIGEATAQLFLEEGASVALVDSNPDDLTAVADALSAGLDDPGRVLALPTDITSDDAVRRSVDTVLSTFGRFDVLANIAGVRVPPGDVTTIPLDHWQHVYDVNVVGGLLCAKYAVPAMTAQGGGSIVFLSSTGAQGARAGWAPYDMSKAALFALARDMSCDHVQAGIRVNVLVPGPTLTKFHVRNLAANQGTSYADAEATLKSRGAPCLMNRQADPREIAYGLLFLASDESSFVTGSIMNVDGGTAESNTAVPAPSAPAKT